MYFITRLINKRITNLISKFDVPEIPPYMSDQIVDHIGVNKEVTTRN